MSIGDPGCVTLGNHVWLREHSNSYVAGLKSFSRQAEIRAQAYQALMAFLEAQPEEDEPDGATAS